MGEGWSGREIVSSNLEHGLSAAIRFMTEKHATLKNDYRTPDGLYAEACSVVALEVAKLIITAGETPTLMRIRGLEITEGFSAGNHRLLSPRIYEGRVTWGGHVVCVSRDVVYDPMIGEPKGISDYKENTFTEPVEMEELMSTEEIQNFINRTSG